MYPECVWSGVDILKYIIFILLASLFFSSCNSADPAPAPDPEIISWGLTADANEGIEVDMVGTVTDHPAGGYLEMTVPVDFDRENRVPWFEVSSGTQISPTGAMNLTSTTITASNKDGKELYYGFVFNYE